MKPVRVTFLMPCYAWRPMGGFRVVYEYASRLVACGLYVTVVHRLRPTLRHLLKTYVFSLETTSSE
jgi:hypothetical protein